MSNYQNGLLSVVVPVFNEEQRLEASLPRVLEYLRQNFTNWEVVYSDDGSTDGTYRKLLQIQAQEPKLRIVTDQQNRGKGCAVRLGLQAAAGDVLLFSDADFSTPIEDTETLLRHLNQGYDFVIGSRALPDSRVEIHQSWARENLGQVGNLIIRSLLPLDYEDTQCGFKMLRRKAAEIILPKLTIDGFAFDVEMLVIAFLHQLKVAEVPVTWRNVLGSKVDPLRNSLEVLRDVLKIRYRLGTGYYS
jgi:dolichyl-phosphate beta-glucosyltransferase